MDGLQFGEGTTPREIADPERRASLPGEKPTGSSARRGWVTAGGGVFLALFVAFVNPFVGTESGRSISTIAPVSSGYSLGFGSTFVFACKGQKLYLSCDAKVKSGSLNIHIWPRSLVPKLESSLKTFRIERDFKSTTAIGGITKSCG